MTKFEQRFIIASRPSHIPADYIIFNAPRPLWASRDEQENLYLWQGPFVSGIFYAAVGPNDPSALSWIYHNFQQGAIVLEYITEEEAKDMVRPSLMASDLSNEDFELVWRDNFDIYHRLSRVEIG